MRRARWPAGYEIRVDGVLEDWWSGWFEGLQIEVEGGETILTGMLPDQPALYGVLEKVRDLGLSVITVRRIPAEQQTGDDG